MKEIKAGSSVPQPKPEVLAQIDSYDIVKIPNDSNFAIYEAEYRDGEQQFLHMESYPSTEERSSFFAANWESAIPLGTFLEDTERFFTRFEDATSDYPNEVELVINNDEGLQIYEGERPVTLADIAETGDKSSDAQAEKVKFLRIENDLAAFTWEPENMGFIVSQNGYESPEELHDVLSEMYDASNPAVPTPVFQRMLHIASIDSFQKPSNQFHL